MLTLILVFKIEELILDALKSKISIFMVKN